MRNWFEEHLTKQTILPWIVFYLARDYLVNVLHGVDILANCALFGNRGETISGRAGRGKVRGSRFWALVAFPIDTLFYLIGMDKRGHHCTKTAYDEMYKSTLTPMTYHEFLMGRSKYAKN